MFGTDGRKTVQNVPMKSQSKISADGLLTSQEITCTREISTHFHGTIKSGPSLFMSQTGLQD